MANFTIDPTRYISIMSMSYQAANIKPGVPLLDRDLNLLAGIRNRALRGVLSQYLGEGIENDADTGFKITATGADNDFLIESGSALVFGLTASNPNSLTYSSQAGVAALTTPSGTGSRTDTVFLDVWFADVEGTEYDQLVQAFQSELGVDLNEAGVQALVPQKLQWAVRVAEDDTLHYDYYMFTLGHLVIPLATLNRPAGQSAITQTMIVDARPRLRLHSRLSTVEKALAPAFVTTPFNELSRTYATASEQVTLYGRNFHIDGLDVRLQPGNVQAEIVAPPTATEISIKLSSPSCVAGTEYSIEVNTNMGSATSTTQLLFLYGDGSPQFAATPVSPATAIAGSTVTLNGINFIANPVVQIGGAQVIVNSATYDSIVITVPTVWNQLPATVSVEVSTDYGNPVTAQDALYVTAS